MQTRLVNQLTACLKAYYPVALSLFEPAAPTFHLALSRTRIRRCTPHKQAASVEQLISVLKQAGHHQADTFARKIFSTLQQFHLLADPITTRTKPRLMLALVSQLLPLTRANCCLR